MKKYLAVAAIAVALVSCGEDNEPADTTAPISADTVGPVTTDSAAAGIANPASEYCEAQGGTVELVDEADGQVGYCNLPDGQRIEEWEFYNSANG